MFVLPSTFLCVFAICRLSHSEIAFICISSFILMAEVKDQIFFPPFYMNFTEHYLELLICSFAIEVRCADGPSVKLHIGSTNQYCTNSHLTFPSINSHFLPFIYFIFIISVFTVPVVTSVYVPLGDVCHP